MIFEDAALLELSGVNGPYRSLALVGSVCTGATVVVWGDDIELVGQGSNSLTIL